MSRIEKAIEKATRLRDSISPEMISVRPENTDALPRASERANETVIKLNSSDVDTHIVALHEPFSPAAEEYRKLKSAILNMNKKRKSASNVIAVTSSIGSEGKSITAANLAITIAKTNEHEILLIDADLRRPTLHWLLNISTETGLSDCINDGIDIGDAIVRVEPVKLAFMSAGKVTGKPAASFSLNKLMDALEDVKKRYPDSLIIIDTPPLLPFAETRLLCSLADGVVFVVKDDMATMQNVSESMEILHDSNVLGIVYNDVSIESLSSSYRYDYYQNYSKLNGNY
jgi:exopolysaccharide/PEP-CTERM locus tyrosine autokinase